MALLFCMVGSGSVRLVSTFKAILPPHFFREQMNALACCADHVMGVRKLRFSLNVGSTGARVRERLGCKSGELSLDIVSNSWYFFQGLP
jgi:hypothetical protein